MKLCDLTQFYSPVSGGVKRYIQEKVAYLRAYESDVEHVLIIPGERTERIEGDRSRVYTIASPLVSRTARYRALLNLHAVEEVLELERPDLVESGDPYQMAWKAIASGRTLRVPVVGFYHSHFPEAYLRTAMRFFGRIPTAMAMEAARVYVRTLYSRFERTLVPSNALADLLTEWGVGNTTVTDLGVNTSIFKHLPEDGAQTRRTLGIPEDRCLLLYVGRLAVEKNTRILFEAFRLLERQQPRKFHLFIMGDGNQREDLQALQAEFGEIDSPITWRSYCSDSAELAQYYRAADLFVHPGVLETFGLVTLEAQACGTPVVGIHGSYMDRIIFSSQTHWARQNSGEALATAISAMAEQDLRTLGAAAAQSVAARYSWTEVFNRLFEVYRSVIAGYKRP